MPIPTKVISLPKNVSALPWTGERFVPGVVGQVQMEHIHRYVSAMQLCHDKTVLDIASGEGYGCFMLAQVAKSVIGVDIDPVSIQASNEKYASEKISFKIGSCAEIPIADNSVDVVISFETIEHIREQELFVEEVKRVLKPDGIFIVSTPDRIVATPLGSPPNPFHIREFYREEFYNMLKKHYDNVLFFGQRSITGSLIFQDGRNFYGEPEEIFFATANTHGSIDCVEFFPRTQNIIAVATNNGITNISFSSSIYEGIFGTLDALNSEYDHITKLHNDSEIKYQNLSTQHSDLLLQHEQLATEHDALLKQHSSLKELHLQHEQLTAEHDVLLKKYSSLEKLHGNLLTEFENVSSELKHSIEQYGLITKIRRIFKELFG